MVSSNGLSTDGLQFVQSQEKGTIKIEESRRNWQCINAACGE